MRCMSDSDSDDSLDLNAIAAHAGGEKLSSNEYGIGSELLIRMGYVEGQGLGANGEGIKTPISQEGQQDQRGLGAGSSVPSLKPVEQHSHKKSLKPKATPYSEQPSQDTLQERLSALRSEHQRLVRIKELINDPESLFLEFGASPEWETLQLGEVAVHSLLSVFSVENDEKALEKTKLFLPMLSDDQLTMLLQAALLPRLKFGNHLLDLWAAFGDILAFIRTDLENIVLQNALEAIFEIDKWTTLVNPDSFIEAAVSQLVNRWRIDDDVLLDHARVLDSYTDLSTSLIDMLRDHYPDPRLIPWLLNDNLWRIFLPDLLNEVRVLVKQKKYEELLIWWKCWKPPSEELKLEILNAINAALDGCPLVKPSPKTRATFRDVVEHFCVANDLEMEDAVTVNGRKAFSINGKLCYIENDALWVESSRGFKPMSLTKLLG